MKSKIIYILLWTIIIITTLFTIAVGICSIAAPVRDQIVFRALTIEVTAAPIWLALCFAAIVLQAVASTILIAIGLKKKRGFERDILLTTIIGIICIVFAVIPIVGGIARMFHGV